MNTTKYVVVLVGTAAVIAAGYDASFCPSGQPDRALCYGPPQELPHGNHDQHPRTPLTQFQIEAVASNPSSNVSGLLWG
jgi:hypothetical protein